MSSVSLSRRGFLQSALLSGLGIALTGPQELIWPDAAAAQSTVPWNGKLIVRSLRFVDWETPVESLKTWITPADLFFVRNHMFEPTTFEAAAWRLTVSGEVERPLSLTLRDLAKLKTASVINALECAGNGRAFYQPHVPGVQWRRGAVGNARFTGPRLKDVLERAGVKSTGKHVMFKGRDEVPGKVPPFIRSIPIEKALDPDTLLATAMNGSPLARHHGYPVRGLVPGWIGAASCKWLTEIRVLEHEFDGNFMNPGYRIPKTTVAPGGSVKPEDTAVITALDVKSVIARPSDGSEQKVGPVPVTGIAWAGEADITRVEVSTDGGRSWHPAHLGRDHAKYAWRMWEYLWEPKAAGSYALMSRATDSRGRIQPAQPPWNPAGYLWNGIDQVKINVTA